MTWSYDRVNKTTDVADRHQIIPRVRMEEAVAKLKGAGFCNQYQVMDIVKALSGLGCGEIRATVEAVFDEERQWHHVCDCGAKFFALYPS